MKQSEEPGRGGSNPCGGVHPPDREPLDCGCPLRSEREAATYFLAHVQADPAGFRNHVRRHWSPEALPDADVEDLLSDVCVTLARRAAARWHGSDAPTPLLRTGGGLIARQLQNERLDAARRDHRRPPHLPVEPEAMEARPDAFDLEEDVVASLPSPDDVALLITGPPDTYWLRALRRVAVPIIVRTVRRLGPSQRSALQHSLGLVEDTELPNPPGSAGYRQALSRARRQLLDAVHDEVGTTGVVGSLTPASLHEIVTLWIVRPSTGLGDASRRLTA